MSCPLTALRAAVTRMSLCYYIPWGNLCFFYQDLRLSSSLISLGTVESGTEFLEQLDQALAVMMM